MRDTKKHIFLLIVIILVAAVGAALLLRFILEKNMDRESEGAAREAEEQTRVEQEKQAAVESVRNIPGYENKETERATPIYGEDGDVEFWAVETEEGVITVEP